MEIYVDFSTLKGKVFKKIEIDKSDYENAILFHCYNGDIYKMYHQQECCESVDLEDVCGDIEDLIDSPIIIAEEVSSHENPKDKEDEEWGTFTWTFYKLATVKGYVTIRWYGTSNGYYSESVDLVLIENKGDENKCW